MPTRLTRLGALAHALIAVTLAAQVAHLVRLDDVWGTGQTWAAVTLLVIGLASCALFAASALTRIPLVGGPRAGGR